MSEPNTATHTATTHPATSAAVRELSSWGGYLQPAAEQSDLIGATPADWARFARHWDDLTVDTYMRDGGVYRYRRYGHFRLDAATGELTALPHGPYRQESSVNPLNGGVERHFDPLTDAFLADPLTRSVVLSLGEIFSGVEGATDWDVKLHPFRIVTSSAETGRPAPQGRHRDGSTFVTSLLVGRTNVSGGESSLYTPDGEQLFATTLTEPGDQLLVDDRAVLHDVTPVTPVDPSVAAHRDVLIVDFDLL
ncbi:2OG-Fe dioxygenase family protein [Streptomyces sp. NPDC002734]|uniref:2OG-Fe dioxygenase family protein n=1 Tax=Streptomyces sp. NPDC002734 TaxID=3154426 RepID=UPI00331DED63